MSGQRATIELLDDQAGATRLQSTQRLCVEGVALDRNTDGQVVLKAGFPTAKSIRTSTTQSIPTGVWTSINFDTEEWNEGPGAASATTRLYDSASSTSRFTIPTGYDGLYEIGGGMIFINSASGTHRTIRIRKNGVTTLGSSFHTPDAVQLTTSMITIQDKAVATDFYEIQVIHDVGAALNLQSGFKHNYGYCTRVGR